jgi:putative ABC transport system substrate-binding protein
MGPTVVGPDQLCRRGAPCAARCNERGRIVTLAAQHRLPAMYEEREYANDGGLISYGRDVSAQFRQAAGYANKILKGTRPVDLPIQQVTTFELVVNLKRRSSSD